MVWCSVQNLGAATIPNSRAASGLDVCLRANVLLSLCVVPACWWGPCLISLPMQFPSIFQPLNHLDGLTVYYPYQTVLWVIVLFHRSESSYKACGERVKGTQASWLHSSCSVWLLFKMLNICTGRRWVMFRKIPSSCSINWDFFTSWEETEEQ